MHDSSGLPGFLARTEWPELAEDLGAVPEGATWPVSCIDWGAAWRELDIGGDYTSESASGGGVHVFRRA